MRTYLDGAHHPPERAVALPGNLPEAYKRYPSSLRAPLGDGEVGALLRWTNGLVRMRWLGGVPPAGAGQGTPVLTPGRPAPSSGARYPVEVYAAVPDTGSLPAGLYHYDPAHHAADRLRSGDGRSALLACLAEPPEGAPEYVLVLTTVFWRNAVKYGAFGYRLQNLDTGVVARQALVAAARFGHPGRLHLRFDDTELNRILGLHAFEESAVAVVTLGHDSRTDSAGYHTADWSGRVPLQLSEATAIDRVPHLTDMAALHAASLWRSASEGRAPADASPRRPAAAVGSPGEQTSVPDAVPETGPGSPTVRRTVYGFKSAELDQARFDRLVRAAARSSSADTDSVLPAPTRTVYVVRRVEGTPPGGYVIDPDTGAPRRTRDGSAVEALVSVAKSPMLVDECRSAPVTVVVAGDLDSGSGVFADRWYRMQNVLAGTVAQSHCLAANELGLHTHVHCDFDVAGMDAVLGLPPRWRALVVITVGEARGGRDDPQVRL
ncbi:SagB family peptide dehydrogenase [Nocardiopsis kunsanensis]|uniref:SagB family peptide dehydrogenase n=1 Tax=Nocardiopsis kunsanensis TaxID=141693 RepID=UPI001267E5A7|nr:SagB family peptide dehydrogenase [Nocardiopsis kunsanensis]